MFLFDMMSQPESYERLSITALSPGLLFFSDLSSIPHGCFSFLISAPSPGFLLTSDLSSISGAAARLRFQPRPRCWQGWLSDLSLALAAPEDGG